MSTNGYSKSNRSTSRCNQISDDLLLITYFRCYIYLVRGKSNLLVSQIIKQIIKQLYDFGFVDNIQNIT